jgi:hypothetical protein
MGAAVKGSRGYIKLYPTTMAPATTWVFERTRFRVRSAIGL